MRSRKSKTAYKSNIKAYCKEHSLPYEAVEEAWLDHKIEK